MMVSDRVIEWASVFVDITVVLVENVLLLSTGPTMTN